MNVLYQLTERVYWMDFSREIANMHLSAGVSWAREKRYDKAISEYRIAVSLRPDYVLAHINLGLAYVENGEHDAAATEFTTAIKLAPENVSAHYNLGCLFTLNDNMVQGEQELLLTIRLDNQHYMAYHMLAVTQMLMLKWDEAIANTLRSIKIKPTYCSSYVSLVIFVCGKIRYHFL